MDNQVEQERGAIRLKIKERYENGEIKDIKVQLVEDQFEIGNVYYAEFLVREAPDEDDDVESKDGEWEEDFYYALMGHNEIQLFDDGIEVIRGLNLELQRKKSFWQRFSDFSLVDAVGAMIAFLLTAAFVGRYFFRITYSATVPDIDKDLVSVFTVVVGYYFGRVSSVAQHKIRS